MRALLTILNNTTNNQQKPSNFTTTNIEIKPIGYIIIGILIGIGITALTIFLIKIFKDKNNKKKR